MKHGLLLIFIHSVTHVRVDNMFSKLMAVERSISLFPALYKHCVKIVKTNNSEQLLKETKENKQKTPCNILLPKKSKKYSNFSFWNGANITMLSLHVWSLQNKRG